MGKQTQRTADVRSALGPSIPRSAVLASLALVLALVLTGCFGAGSGTAPPAVVSARSAEEASTTLKCSAGKAPVAFHLDLKTSEYGWTCETPLRCPAEEEVVWMPQQTDDQYLKMYGADVRGRCLAKCTRGARNFSGSCQIPSEAVATSSSATSPVPSVEVPREAPPTPSAGRSSASSTEAGKAAWDRAMKEDRATQVSSLDEWEAKLSASERAKQPWTRATLDQFNGLATILHSLPVPSEKDPLRARNEELLRRTERLLPVADDSEWALASKACASAVTLDDCEAVSEYSKKPKRRHLAEAKAMLDSPKYKALVMNRARAIQEQVRQQNEDKNQRCNVCIGHCVAARREQDHCRFYECSDVCR